MLLKKTNKLIIFMFIELAINKLNRKLNRNII